MKTILRGRPGVVRASLRCGPEIAGRYPASHEGGVHHKALGCGAGEIKGVTSDEVQDGLAGGPQRRVIARRHNGNARDAVNKGAGRRFDLNPVALPDVLQQAEMSIAVAGDHAVAVRSRKCRSLQMSRATAEVSRIRAFDYVEDGMQARDREARESFSGGDHAARF